MKQFNDVIIVILSSAVFYYLAWHSSLMLVQPDTKWVDIVVIALVPFGVCKIYQLLLDFVRWYNGK